MTGGRERRKYQRKAAADLWVDVTICSAFISENTPSKVITAKIDNLSDGGVCLISSHPFELDQILSFSDAKFPQRGKVVWTCLSKTECKAGIQFLPESPAT